VLQKQISFGNENKAIVAILIIPKYVSKNESHAMNDTKKKIIGNGIGIGAALGVAFGAAYGKHSGSMLNPIAMGLAFGVTIGAIFDFLQSKKRNK
jgi:drug/metabolite transporter (DMT)-like permease